MSTTSDDTAVTPEISIEGWTFADSAEMEWQPIGEGVAMKLMAPADGRVLALFKFDAGYAGAGHDHADAEFSYILEGSVVHNGVLMHAGHAYAAQTGTRHEQFYTDTGCTLLSVFQNPF